MKLQRNKEQQVVRQRRQVSRGQTPAAFSYYAQRSERSANTGRGEQVESGTGKPNVWESLLQRVGLLILAGVIVVVVINNLLLSSSPRVIALQSGGSQQFFLHPMADYQQSITAILKQSVWNANKLTINTSAISSKVKRQFPELASVSIALPLLGHRPVAYIAPNQPALILNAKSGSYVVDSSGTVVLPTTELPAGTQLSLPVISDQTGLHVVTGRQVLTSDNVNFILQVLAQLKAHSIAIGSLALPAAASELDVYPSSQPYYVKFNLHATAADARQQAGTFIAVQKKLASEGIAPGKYIDVRLDGRAYYQ